MSELTRSFSVATTPAMLSELDRVAKEWRMPKSQIARMAVSLFLQYGASYATPPPQEIQRETISAD